ncbi:MAG: hypothetical protein ABI422_07950 [Sphingomicrobium sp.]
MTASVLSLLGCGGHAAHGQVIAVVNGDEITISELNEETRARGLVIGNSRELRDAIVQDLIDRKLLVQAAVSSKVDRTPEHLLAKRRLNEILLTQELVAMLRQQRHEVSNSELAQVMRLNPYAFDERVLISVDRITLQSALDPRLARDMAGARSLNDIQLLLASKNLGVERRTELWDSATLSPDISKRILANKERGVILLQFGDRTIAAHIISLIRQPTPEAYRLQFARELLESQQTQQVLQGLLQRAKSNAEIRYQSRFAPRGKGSAHQHRPGESARP